MARARPLRHKEPDDRTTDETDPVPLRQHLVEDRLNKIREAARREGIQRHGGQRRHYPCSMRQGVAEKS